MADRGGAVGAGMAGALVDAELLLEVAGLAVGVDEIPQGGASLFDRLVENLADGFDQTGELWQGQAVGRGCGANAGQIEGFAGVDIAHSDHNFWVHDHLLDRRFSAGTGELELGRSEVVR